MPHAPARTYVPGLDGMRAVAALIVLAGHGADTGLLPAWLGGDWSGTGVTMFFVLSGYLMAHIHLSGPADGAAMRRYVVARVARIVPLYAAVLGLGCLLLATFGHSGYMFTDPAELLPAVLFLSAPSVLWSIPVEVQFYALFLGLWAMGRSRLVWTLPLLLVVQAIAMAANWESASHPFSLEFHLHAFVLGLCTALVVRRTGLPRDGAMAALAGVAAAGLILTPPAIRDGLGLPVLPRFVDPYPLAWSVAVLLAAIWGRGAARVLTVRPVRWIGQISFGVYLLHMPLLFIVRERAPVDGWVAFAVAAALTIAAAWIAQHLVERPGTRIVRAAFGSRRREATTPFA